MGDTDESFLPVLLSRIIGVHKKEETGRMDGGLLCEKMNPQCQFINDADTYYLSFYVLADTNKNL